MGVSEILTEKMVTMIAIALIVPLTVVGMLMVTNEGTVLVSATKTNLLFQNNKYTVVFSVKATSKYSEPLFLKQVTAIAYTEAGTRRYTLASDTGVMNGITISIDGISDTNIIQQYLSENKIVLNPNHEMIIVVTFKNLDITSSNNKLYGIVFQLTYKTPSGKTMVFTSNDVSVLRGG